MILPCLLSLIHGKLFGFGPEGDSLFIEIMKGQFLRNMDRSQPMLDGSKQHFIVPGCLVTSIETTDTYQIFPAPELCASGKTAGKSQPWMKIRVMDLASHMLGGKGIVGLSRIDNISIGN